MWSAIIRRTRSISLTSTPGIATGADDLDKVAAGWAAAADVAGATFGLACSEETATDGLLAAGAADAGFGSTLPPLFFFREAQMRKFFFIPLFSNLKEFQFSTEICVI